jgi:hypothetical protein
MALSILLVLLLSAAGLTNAMAQSFTVGDLNYFLNEGGTTVTLTGHMYGTNATGMLDIPSEVTYDGHTYTVTAIADYAFKDCTGLTGNLVIPNSVITIGNKAFSGCFAMHGSLTIGTAVTEIGELAFENCGFHTLNYNATACPSVPYVYFGGVFEGCSSLETLNIGDNVQIIPDNLFRECSGITGSLVLPNTLTTIGTSAFELCSGFTGSLTIPNAVTTIGISAFQSCTGFTGDLIIPNSVTTIGSNAFYYCIGLYGTLTIGTSVTEIGGEAFTSCDFTKVNFNATNCTTMGGYYGGGTHGALNLNGSSNAALIIGENVQTIPTYAFYSCSSFTGSLTLPNSVTSIGEYAFANCTGFTGSLTLSESLTTIGDYAFGWCSGFTGSLTIPNSVTTIGYAAFNGCSSISGTLTIGSSVTSIGNGAFAGCNNITSLLMLTETPPSIWFNSFANLYLSSGLVIVPCGTLGAYQNAAVWNEFTLRDVCDLLTYSINDDGVSVTVTGHVDGTGATGPLIIPETKTIDGVTYTVTAIKNDAFRNYRGLTGDLVIPNSVVTIGSRAFMNCSGFTSLTLGNSLTTISIGAFSNCNSFTGSLILPESLTIILGNAFQNCSGFTGDLTIPAGVTSLGSAFAGCSGFTSLTMLPTVPPVNNPFGSSPYDIPVTVSCGSWSLYRYAYNWTGFTSIQEDCSGTYEVMATANPVEGGSVIFGTEGETLFADSFGSYTAGSTIAAEAAAVSHDWWTTWSGQTGGDDDGMVVDYGGTRCGHLTYGNDQVLLLNKESGIYEIEFDILVPEGKNAFFSFLHQFDETVNEAVYCHLHMTNVNYQNTITPYHGSIRAGNYNLTDIPCVFDAWMHFRFHVDMDADIARCYYTAPGSEEMLLCQWPWSWNSNTAAYTDSGLAAMDFWPPMDEATSEYYIDNFCLKQYEVGNTMLPGNHFAQGATCTLTAIPNEDYAFINWTESGQEVSTDAEYSFTVTGDADYVANFASEGLHWDFNPEAFANSMTVMGIVMIDSVEQHNPSWEIGAFHGDECRGSARLANELRSATGQLYFVLTVYGNVDGEEITFQLYDHILEQSLDLDCSTSLGFAAGESFGDPNNLLPLNFVDGEMVQTTDLSQGYNWWSTYIEQEGVNGLEMLENGLGGNGVAIRSQASGYTDYYGEDYGWWGSLTSINNESSYRVVASTPCTVTMTGTEAVPSQHPITLNHGWTWMGYVPSTAMDVNTAMAGMEATDGDMLKSQLGYSDYYEGYGWFGSLNTIEPGMGLMYYSSNGETVSFTYPDNTRGGELKQNLTAENNHWKPNTFAYPDNMTVMATIELDGEELNSEYYELAAFASNGECRGSVKLTYVEPINRHVAFLTISGKDAAELSFRLYDMETGMEYYDAEESLDFVTNAIVGTADDLYTIHFRGTTGMDELASQVQVYPNPVNAGERFSINVANDVKNPVRVEIVNALGVETLRATSVQMPAQLTAPATAGIYTLRITVEGKGTVVRKQVVK